MLDRSMEISCSQCGSEIVVRAGAATQSVVIAYRLRAEAGKNPPLAALCPRCEAKAMASPVAGIQPLLPARRFEGESIPLSDRFGDSSNELGGESSGKLTQTLAGAGKKESACIPAWVLKSEGIVLAGMLVPDGSRRGVTRLISPASLPEPGREASHLEETEAG